MFGKISDICGLITNLCLVYIIVIGVIIPIYKTKNNAKEYKIIGGKNVAQAVLFAIGGIICFVVNYMSNNQNSISIFLMMIFYFLGIYKMVQYVVFADNKYGVGKNAIDLENVDKVRFYTNRTWDNIEFSFKDGTSKRGKIPKKILGEVEPLINEKLEQIKKKEIISIKEE